MLFIFDDSKVRLQFHLKTLRFGSTPRDKVLSEGGYAFSYFYLKSLSVSVRNRSRSDSPKQPFLWFPAPQAQSLTETWMGNPGLVPYQTGVPPPSYPDFLGGTNGEGDQEYSHIHLFKNVQKKETGN